MTDDVRTQLAEALAAQHSCDTLLHTSGLPCNRCHQSVEALLPVVESIATQRAADELAAAADAGALTAPYRSWLHTRADALRGCSVCREIGGPHGVPECPLSQRVDGPLHSWRFDGDDPYVVCVYCDQMQDARTGRVIREARSR